MPCQRWRSQATAVAGLIAGLAAPPAGSHTARHKLPSTTGCRKERTRSEARVGQACPGRTAPKGKSRPRCQRTHGPTPLPWAAPSHCMVGRLAGCTPAAQPALALRLSPLCLTGAPEMRGAWTQHQVALALVLAALLAFLATVPRRCQGISHTIATLVCSRPVLCFST